MLKVCENGRGVVLLLVVRGKVSEGIDFGKNFIYNVFYINLFFFFIEDCDYYILFLMCFFDFIFFDFKRF